MTVCVSLSPSSAVPCEVCIRTLTDAVPCALCRCGRMSGDLRSMHPADPASHARAQWDDQLRDGVGSGGLRVREEGERGEHRGAGSRGGEVGTHRSIHSD